MRRYGDVSYSACPAIPWSWPALSGVARQRVSGRGRGQVRSLDARGAGVSGQPGGIVRLVGAGSERAGRRSAAGGASAAKADAGPSDDAAEAERARELEQERKLCERARTGDRAALAQLLRKHGPVLYRSVLLPRLGNEAAAQDALADTYVRVVERFSQFEWRGCGIYPWLRVIAMRIAVDALRSRKRETLFDPMAMGRALEQAERDMEDGIDEQLCQKRDLAAARARMEEALATINERYARAIRIRIVEERSRQEAARMLGVSVPTFDVVLHRALAALRRAISAQEAEG